MKKFIKILIMLFSILQTAHAKEIKLGLMQHDFDTKLGHRYEKGQNIIIEYLFDKMQNYLRAFPYIGASINNKGYTSNIYTGFTWQFDIKDIFIIEATLGASINNAERLEPKKKRALGSKLLFRESFSIGYLIDKTHSISLMIDHISSADIRKPNPGITDIGIRYGFRF